MRDPRYIPNSWVPTSYCHCQFTANSSIEIGEYRRKREVLGSALAVKIPRVGTRYKVYIYRGSLISNYQLHHCVLYIETIIFSVLHNCW